MTDSTRAASLAAELRADITERGLAEGDFFGTDAQIGQRYGVSRSIVREAVGRLAALGILRGRRRKGLIVGRSNPVGLLSGALPFSGRSSEQLAHLGQLRRVLELGAIELSVRQATPNQIAGLIQLADDFARASDAHDVRELDRTDLAFHCLLLEMTGNPLVSGMHQVLAEHFQALALPPGHPAVISNDPRSVWDHRAIAHAVAAGNQELARVLLKSHLELI